MNSAIFMRMKDPSLRKLYIENRAKEIVIVGSVIIVLKILTCLFTFIGINNIDPYERKLFFICRAASLAL